ncbi:hypothetical protein J4437_02425 [Candidatus Woesearchaeota archaeon]|nr:hypothetical protein [Candidatus Woesearchaeota archaeon]
MSYLKNILLGISFASFLYSSTFAAPVEDVSKNVEKLKKIGKKDPINVKGISSIKYELALDGSDINGVTYDYVRFSYVPAKDQTRDLTSLSLALFKKTKFGKYDGLIIYDGSRYGKMDGNPDKILHREFSLMEMLEMSWTDGECLEKYSHTNPDANSRKIYDYFLKNNSL